MSYKIFEYDPGLKMFEVDIELRMKNYIRKRKELVGDCNLCDFANGHEYFGFHKTENGWYYREWAPEADEVYLTGEMVELILTDVPNIVCIQPFACLPNHVVGKGVIKVLKKAYPQANIIAVDYDPGTSEVNQLNRIKLMLSTAQKNADIALTTIK